MKTHGPGSESVHVMRNISTMTTCTHLSELSVEHFHLSGDICVMVRLALLFLKPVTLEHDPKQRKSQSDGRNK